MKRPSAVFTIFWRSTPPRCLRRSNCSGGVKLRRNPAEKPRATNSRSSPGVRSRRASAATPKESNRADLNETGGREVRFGPLATYIGYALRRAQMSSVAGFLEAMKDVDLRPTQFAVLSLI